MACGYVSHTCIHRNRKNIRYIKIVILYSNDNKYDNRTKKEWILIIVVHYPTNNFKKPRPFGFHSLEVGTKILKENLKGLDLIVGGRVGVTLDGPQYTIHPITAMCTYMYLQRDQGTKQDIKTDHECC